MALPDLNDDTASEILLRLPPDDPASLVRASLVCKPWLRLLSYPAFLRRYREFHGAPPLLGFLRNVFEGGPYARFVPTTGASLFSGPAFAGASRWAMDCCHGRALIYSFASRSIILWDPVSGDQQLVPAPTYPDVYYAAAVLCAADGCSHLQCQGGPFRVVFVGTQADTYAGGTCASVYSSETGTWSASISIQLDHYIDQRPSLFTGDALYFSLQAGKYILKYDLVGRGLSLINAPDVYEQPEGIAVAAADGGLGFAGVRDDRLYLWSWQTGPDGAAGWEQRSIVKLKALVPVLNQSTSFGIVGSTEGTDTVFISTDAGIFTVMLKSGKVRKVGDGGSCYAILPYMSFYTPDLTQKIASLRQP